MRIFIALLFPKLIKDEFYRTLEILIDNYRGNYSQLKLLHKRVIFASEKAGVEIDNANFSPHITLGRKVEIGFDDLNNLKIRELDIPITRVSIMESKRVDEELVYEEIAYIKLQ